MVTITPFFEESKYFPITERSFLYKNQQNANIRRSGETTRKYSHKRSGRAVRNNSLTHK